MAERINWNEKVIEYLKQILERIKSSVTQTILDADYTVLSSDDCIVITGTHVVNLLPVASAPQKPLTIVNMDSGTITVTPDGSEKINNSASYALAAKYKVVTIFPASTEWVIISAN